MKGVEGGERMQMPQSLFSSFTEEPQQEAEETLDSRRLPVGSRAFTPPAHQRVAGRKKLIPSGRFPFPANSSISTEEPCVWKVAQPWQDQQRRPDDALGQNVQDLPKRKKMCALG